MLSVQHLSKRYGEVEAVRAVSLGVEEGAFVSIVGPSGCGKSTLMEIVGGLVAPTAGEITIAGTPVDGTDPAIGIVFQQESAFPWRTVAENVEFGLEMTGVGKDERRERAQAMIELVGL